MVGTTIGHYKVLEKIGERKKERSTGPNRGPQTEKPWHWWLLAYETCIPIHYIKGHALWGGRSNGRRGMRSNLR